MRSRGPLLLKRDLIKSEDEYLYLICFSLLTTVHFFLLLSIFIILLCLVETFKYVKLSGMFGCKISNVAYCERETREGIDDPNKCNVVYVVYIMFFSCK